MEVRLCAWPRWISRCRFDFRAFVTLASAMRVQPPILVPCFAKQIRVVVHSAPSMDHDSGTWRAKFRNLNFVSKIWVDRTAVFLGQIRRCIACRRISFLAFVSSCLFSRMCRRCMCVVREARDVSRWKGQKLMFLMKHISDYFLRFLSQHDKVCETVVFLSACFGNRYVTTLN